MSITPFLMNLRILTQLSRVHMTAAFDVEQHVQRSCSICVFILNEWPRISRHKAIRSSIFSTHRGAIVIPYQMRGGSVAAYLPTSVGSCGAVEPFDFENPPSDVVYAPEDKALLQKAGKLSKALFDWAKAGFALAPADVCTQRKSICQGCEFWKGDGFNGMGKCTKCGCSGVKLKLATSSCPIGMWDAVDHS